MLDVFVPKRVLHDVGDLLVEFLKSLLVRLFARFHFLDVLGSALTVQFLFVVGDRLALFERTFFVANAIIELLEHLIHPLAHALGVFLRREDVDGEFVRLARHTLGQIIECIAGQLDNRVLRHTEFSGRPCNRLDDFLHRLRASDARHFTWAGRLFFLCRSLRFPILPKLAHPILVVAFLHFGLGLFTDATSRPRDPDFPQPIVIAAREREAHIFMRQNRDLLLLQALQLNARLRVLSRADANGVRLHRREPVNVRPAQRDLFSKFFEWRDGRGENVPLRLGRMCCLADAHLAAAHVVADFSLERDLAAREEFRRTAVHFHPRLRVAKVVGQLHARREFLQLRPVQWMHDDVLQVVAKAQAQRALAGLAGKFKQRLSF